MKKRLVKKAESKESILLALESSEGSQSEMSVPDKVHMQLTSPLGLHDNDLSEALESPASISPTKLVRKGDDTFGGHGEETPITPGFGALFNKPNLVQTEPSIERKTTVNLLQANRLFGENYDVLNSKALKGLKN